MRITEKVARIDADLLIPGRGDLIHHASLVYTGTVITFVGKTSDLPSEHRDVKPSIRVPVLMPGLWDCHVHLTGMAQFSVDAMAATPQFIAGMRCARDAVATLNAGYTSVREMAGYGVEITKVINDGWIPGPKIYSSVSMLSQTAGHGDARDVPLTCLWDRIEHGLPFHLCDGVDECIKAVRVQIRRGASVIKVAASGGVASSGDDIHVRQFNDEELKAIVDEATRNKLNVGAHCHSSEAIEAALHAGIKTIEHGTFLDENPKLVDMMREKGAMLVATHGILEYALSHPGDWSDEAWKKMLETKEHHARSYAMAVKAGVKCALGTDLGVSAIKTDWNHGMNGREFKYAVDAGMTPLQAIEAGTANGPDTLGPKAPKSGQLKKGYDADFIALDINPVDRIEVLGQPNQIKFVWRGGKLYKRDGIPINMLDLPGGM